MMVIFVSQCEKKALPRTRRVLDAFADRIGDNTWQTIITQEGLLAVKKLLRKTASKNTAVSCHWIRSRSRSDLLWVVGRRFAFDEIGRVAVNSTELDLSHSEWENGWHQNEIILLAASIAGLFHDFGKANSLFQEKLNGQSDLKSEPYRHEWVSLRLFEALVISKPDSDWLNLLANIEKTGSEIEAHVIANLVKDNQTLRNPFKNLAPFAKLVAWLIVSHHRLPFPQTSDSHVCLKQMDEWLELQFNANWNSRNAEAIADIPEATLSNNWHFPFGTPFISKTWQLKAQQIAKRALSYPGLVESKDWLKQRFISHLARLSLMLADHYYSSLPATDCKSKWQDRSYKAYANTDRDNNSQLKQKLDEHNIGVAQNAAKFVSNLPSLKYTLPSLIGHKAFSKNAPEDYAWQDKAYRGAKSWAAPSEKQGFFGINMASTGCGKTMANARIMYALADEKEGCRFSVALGLRTLTLQTGDAYRDLLKLSDSELAVLIGSQAIKSLHQLNSEKVSEKPQTGSESEDDFLAELQINYEGQIYDGRLKRWLSASPKLEQLVSAPVVVSTIDHLMPATESKRGGKQIAPMLRLLTSDLVLDEPDDFSLEDLPALCRLVNWAGMLGSRVLLSSATLPPALVSALFDAYRAGRQHYNRANLGLETDPLIVSGWFDEYKTLIVEAPTTKHFNTQHKDFVQSRVNRLNKNHKALRKAQIKDIEPLEQGESQHQLLHQAYQSVAKTVHEQIHQLHKDHHVKSPWGHNVSLGVVRFANIDPMVAISQIIGEIPPKDNHIFHLCVYHSQFPLALRSYKESRLDKTLCRHNEAMLWEHDEIQSAIKHSQTKNHVFIVLGTSVVEVGRDHDYDWAIAEPSSLRAIIQLAGRVQRHRRQSPSSENMVVLNQNIRALKNEKIAYCRPGFESKQLPLSTHELKHLLNDELRDISAIPRIIEPKMTTTDFGRNQNSKDSANPVDSMLIQEHRALRITLDNLGKNKNESQFFQPHNEASLWWKKHADWNAEYIKQTEFRKSEPSEEFTLRISNEVLEWSQKDDSRYPAIYVPKNQWFSEQTTRLAAGVQWWFNKEPEDIYKYLAEQFDIPIETASERYGAINLRMKRDNDHNAWHWNHQLGVFNKRR